MNNIKGVQDTSNSTMTSYYSDNNVSEVKSSSAVKAVKEVEVSNKSNNSEKEKKEVEKAVKKLNKFLEDDKTHAEYSIHKELGTIMIKVIDDKDGKVLLEVPSKKILDMIASMCESFGILDKKA